MVTFQPHIHHLSPEEAQIIYFRQKRSFAFGEPGSGSWSCSVVRIGNSLYVIHCFKSFNNCIFFLEIKFNVEYIYRFFSWHEIFLKINKILYKDRYHEEKVTLDYDTKKYLSISILIRRRFWNLKQNIWIPFLMVSRIYESASVIFSRIYVKNV